MFFFSVFFSLLSPDSVEGPVHITISEPSPEAKPSNVLLPLSLDDEGGGGDLAVTSDRNRKQQQHLQQHATNVSITITDASPDSACGSKPLSAVTPSTSCSASSNVGAAAAAATVGTTAHTKRLAFRRASEVKIVQHKALVHRTSEGPPPRS